MFDPVADHRPERSFKRREGVAEARIHRVGNIMIDSFEMMRSAIEADDLQLAPDEMGGENPGRGSETLDDYLNRLERQAILEALQKTEGNRTAAARLLGVTFRSLRYRSDFTTAAKLRRFAWEVVWLLAFRPTPSSSTPALASSSW